MVCNRDSWGSGTTAYPKCTCSGDAENDKLKAFTVVQGINTTTTEAV